MSHLFRPPIPLKGPAALAALLGQSPAMTRLRDEIANLARTPYPVVIEGPTGSGKELVAHAMHGLSARAGEAFVTLNCAVLHDETARSELFGHKRGSFTGALQDQAGAFSQAHGGTLFLDEVAELSAAAQAMLLRTLENGEIHPVGGRAEWVDVRVIAASHTELQEQVASGRFREDLLQRLAVIHVEVPSLFDRISDLPELVEHFSRQARPEAELRWTGAALEVLARHGWPGNVRELRSTVQRTLARAWSKTVIDASDIAFAPGKVPRIATCASSNDPDFLYLPGLTEAGAVAEVRRRCLARHGWVKSAAARELDISRSVLTGVRPPGSGREE